MAKLLTTITPATNVPADTKVVAFNKHGDIQIGTLHKCGDDSYRCSDDWNTLHDITEYITIENLRR